MKHPWEQIALSDYENHMQLNTVMQLQALNDIMRQQLNRFPVDSAMVLGVAGGNGLEHADPSRLKRLYGVDVNREYLDACISRYPNLCGVLTCIQADLTHEDLRLPTCDLLIANLLVEYIGCDCFGRVVGQVQPEYVSCAIQIDLNGAFVSDSPYLHVFDCLDEIHRSVDADVLIQKMAEIGYCSIDKEELSLPNGKSLLRLDFQSEALNEEGVK